MKKRWFPAGLLMLLLLAFCVFRPNMAKADEQTVTLTIKGSSGSVSLLSEEDVLIVVRAPGATAVRIWDPGRDEFEYYDRNEPLGYLEVTWSYSLEANNQSVYAEARYDDYSEDVEFWDEPESVWTTQSKFCPAEESPPQTVLLTLRMYLLNQIPLRRAVGCTHTSTRLSASTSGTGPKSYSRMKTGTTENTRIISTLMIRTVCTFRPLSLSPAIILCTSITVHRAMNTAKPA